MTTRNITKAYRLSTTEDRRAGEGWYAEAYDYAANLDPTNVSRAAGIIAALSPLQHWDVNKRQAAAFYEGRWSVHTTDNVIKCLKIAAGAEPLDVLGGKKVRAFYMNIMGMSEDETVTIDRHAIAVCEGRVIPEPELKAYFGVKRNRAYVEEYKRAAKILSRELGYRLTPADVQATVWVYWRRTRGATV